MPEPNDFIEASRFYEFEMLGTCALRFDGYAWTKAKRRSQEKLMNGYWEPGSFPSLMRARPDTQWAVWFLQQRTYRWRDSEPAADGVALWRQLFLRLADLDPDPRFRAGDLGEYANAEWDSKYRPHLGELKWAVADRLARGADLFEPLTLSEEARGLR